MRAILVGAVLISIGLSTPGHTQNIDLDGEIDEKTLRIAQLRRS
jgi:hypothetical protein